MVSKQASTMIVALRCLCADLFTWVSGRNITREQAMMCARRLPGRSWEAVDEELRKLGAQWLSA
jgi:hypothetical protein